MEHFAGWRHTCTLTAVIQTEIENWAFQALLCIQQCQYSRYGLAMLENHWCYVILKLFALRHVNWRSFLPTYLLTNTFPAQHGWLNWVTLVTDTSRITSIIHYVTYININDYLFLRHFAPHHTKIFCRNMIATQHRAWRVYKQRKTRVKLWMQLRMSKVTTSNAIMPLFTFLWGASEDDH